MAGRPAGSKNKNTLLRRWAGTNKDAGLFLLDILADELAPMESRIDAAKTLLPYMHKKLPIDSNMELTLPENITIKIGHADNA